jgi:hypothetical protein
MMKNKVFAASSILTMCLLLQGVFIFLLWLGGALRPEFDFFRRWVGPVSVGLLPVSLLTINAGFLLLAEQIGLLQLSFNREAFFDAMETLSPYLGLLGTVISIIFATLQWDLVHDAQRVFQQIMGSVGAGLGSTVYGLVIALLARVFRYLFPGFEGAT